MHTTEDPDISAQTAVSSKNVTAARKNAEILRKEAASAETASVSATSAPITPNAVLISITTMPQKPMKSIFPPSAIHEKA